MSLVKLWYVNGFEIFFFRKFRRVSTQIPPYFPVFYRLIFPGQNALFRGIKCRITSEPLEGSAQIRCHSLSLNEWNSEITKIYISMHFQNLPGQANTANKLLKSQIFDQHWLICEESLHHACTNNFCHQFHKISAEYAG